MSDLISRQAAIDAFMKATSDGDKFEWCEWVLKQVPSARPTGEWLFNTNMYNGKSWNICSVCGYSRFHPSNFCTHCGATMVDSQDT